MLSDIDTLFGVLSASAASSSTRFPALSDGVFGVLSASAASTRFPSLSAGTSVGDSGVLSCWPPPFSLVRLHSPSQFSSDHACFPRLAHFMFCSVLIGML